MTVNEALRGIAGFFVLASLALGYFFHPAFLLFTAFVGLNLLQSAFTKTCPMMALLKKLGVKPDGSGGAVGAPPVPPAGPVTTAARV